MSFLGTFIGKDRSVLSVEGPLFTGIGSVLSCPVWTENLAHWEFTHLMPVYLSFENAPSVNCRLTGLFIFYLNMKKQTVIKFPWPCWPADSKFSVHVWLWMKDCWISSSVLLLPACNVRAKSCPFSSATLYSLFGSYMKKKSVGRVGFSLAWQSPKNYFYSEFLHWKNFLKIHYRKLL